MSYTLQDYWRSFCLEDWLVDLKTPEQNFTCLVAKSFVQKFNFGHKNSTCEPQYLGLRLALSSWVPTKAFAMLPNPNPGIMKERVCHPGFAICFDHSINSQIHSADDYEFQHDKGGCTVLPRVQIRKGEDNLRPICRPTDECGQRNEGLRCGGGTKAMLRLPDHLDPSRTRVP